MEIRKYRDTDDLNDVSRVYAQSWKTAYRGIVPQDYLDGIRDNRWAPYLKNDVQRLLVAADGAQIVGAATYNAARDETYAGWGEIISLYLLPAYYRRGLGTRLIHAAIDALHAAGYANVYLWVLEENTSARRFYEKNGFHFCGDILTAEIGGKPLRECRYILPAE